jgi:uncharacterized protein YdaU (DUF1376 family)
LNFYKHHIGDYAQATAHLSFVEDAAYSRLIRKYYAEEAPIPADLKAAQRLVGARSREEREAVQVVLEEFFELRDDGWHNKRCDEELSKANAQAETNRRIAEEREARRRQRQEHEALQQQVNGSLHETSHESSAVREPSQTPDSRRQTPDTTTSGKTNTATTAVVAGARPSADPPPQPPLALVEPTPPPSAKGPPDCPHAAVLALWAEVLPHLPQHDAQQWRGSRADHLRARWRETAASKGWTTQQQGLAYLRRLFGYVGQSPFLTGREHQPGKRPFFAELAWLVEPLNWAKVIEGKYHPMEQTA